MKSYLQEFTVHAYKGIHNLTLESLNAINILTGDNNSGKTSVLELLSTIGNPQDTDAWIRCARIDGLRIRDRLYFNGFYNMFPIDDERKEIAYSLIDGDGKSDEVMLVAELEETQVSEKEMYRLNGLSRMRSVKQEDEVVDTVCMHLYTYLNQNKAHEDVIYDFQNILPRNLNKRKPYVKTVYESVSSFV